MWCSIDPTIGVPIQVFITEEWNEKFPQALHRANQNPKIKSHDGAGETDDLFIQICRTQKLSETVFI